MGRQADHLQTSSKAQPTAARRADRMPGLSCDIMQSILTTTNTTRPLTRTGSRTDTRTQTNRERKGRAQNLLRIMTQLRATESRSFTAAISITDIGCCFLVRTKNKRIMCYYADQRCFCADYQSCASLTKPQRSQQSKLQLGHLIFSLLVSVLHRPVTLPGVDFIIAQ